MAIKLKPFITFSHLFFFTFILLAILSTPGNAAKDTLTLHTYSQSEGWKSARRLMIGSIAPTCTYNECRGCRFKCRAKQVPVDANDPVNSAYHYRCVCHR